MIITQDKLIKQIATIEDIDVATVRDILKTAEDVIFEHLSSSPPSMNVTIKLLSGIALERHYIPEKYYSKGMFKDLSCPAHVNTKANVSKYYQQKINSGLFDRQ